jgi:UDP-glucose 4-epimerase
MPGLGPVVIQWEDVLQSHAGGVPANADQVDDVSVGEGRDPRHVRSGIQTGGMPALHGLTRFGPDSHATDDSLSPAGAGQQRVTSTETSPLVGAKILITGGLGLIGSALARQLITLGCTDILLIDSLIPEFGGNLCNIRDIRDRVRVNISDVRDINGLRYLLRDCDYLFNLAGQTSHMDSMTAPFDDLEINCHAQLALLETCRQYNPSIKIVFASTRQVYGRPMYLPVDEAHPIKPVDVNGIHKLAAESYHTLYHEVYGMHTTVLRLTNTYGPGMRIRDARQIFVGIWVRRLLEGKTFEVWGGDQLRDFTYVDDAAAAFTAAVLTPEAIGKVLNVGGGEAVSLRHLAEQMVEINGAGAFDVIDFPLDRKPIDIGDFHADDSRLRSLTGWRPMVSLQEGLRRTLAYYRTNLSSYT